jgi:hypothetical protein
MRPLNWIKRILVRGMTGAMVLGMALAGVAFAPAGTALAASPAQTPEPPLRQQILELSLQREKLILQGQQLRIEFAHQVAGQVQTWIDRLNGQGKDTSDLAAALAAYNSSLDQAQSSWNNANSILTTAAGFDGDGHVTDQEQALKTVQDAGDALRQTHRILADAGRALRRAVHAFRVANGSTA